MSRDNLVGRVLSYGRRETAGLTDKIINDFIPLGEAMIGRRLRTLENESEQVYSSAPPLARPSDFGAHKLLIAHLAGGDKTVHKLSPSALDQYDVHGEAIKYAMIGGEYDIRGRGTESFTLYYWSRPKLTDTGSNDVYDVHPDLYLWATLVQFYTWARNLEERAFFVDAFNVTVNEANMAAREQAGKGAGRRVA